MWFQSSVFNGVKTRLFFILVRVHRAVEEEEEEEERKRQMRINGRVRKGN